MLEHLRDIVWPGRLALALCALSPGALLGQDADSEPLTQEGALFLLLPVGAQAVSLAGATTALPSAEAAFWNPAGLSTVDRSRVLVYHGNHLTGNATGFSALAARPGTGTIGVSYSLLDVGGLDVTDETGMVVGSIAVRGHQGILSLAVPFTSWVRAGVNAKLVRNGVSCRGQCPEGPSHSTTYAFDVGAQLRPLRSQPFHLGIMVAHVGPRFEEGGAAAGTPLPARLRVGASYRLVSELLEQEVALRMLVEVEDRLRDPGNRSLRLGTELTAGSDDRVFVRGGFSFEEEVESASDGAAIGFGLRYERFEVAIARTIARGGPTSQEEPVHLTLGISF